MKAKNLIYLDEEKMYSISSQIFEGITEYILNEEKTVSDRSESQKGPVASGKILADVLRKEKINTEKKYLHDYAYSLFEKHLVGLDKVIEIDDQSTCDVENEIKKYSFIRVDSRSVFNDSRQINELISNFNEFGEAISYVTNYNAISEAKSQFEKAEESTKDRNAKLRLKQDLKNLTSVSKIARETGLQQDPKFLECLSLLLKFGFNDHLEIQQRRKNLLYSSVLKREFLRESEDVIIRKYSRKPEKNIIVFGIITQFSGGVDIKLNEGDDLGMKEALMNLVEYLANIEQTFTGRLSNEIVIDPIAVYTEL
jgi:hypothetical protein